jgi:hypothetical protein
MRITQEGSPVPEELKINAQLWLKKSFKRRLLMNMRRLFKNTNI